MSSNERLIAEFYASEDRAQAVLDTLRGYEKAHLFEIEDAAVLVRDLDGVVRVRETTGLTAGKGAMRGATILGLASLFFPAGVIVSSMTGAGLGALVGRNKDSDIVATSIRELGSQFSVGQAAVVVLSHDQWQAQIRNILTGRESRIVPTEVDDGFSH